jgi:hypothetical protein
MRRLAVAISFLSPLALAPHVLFYYDVTPKIVILLAGAAVALILVAFCLDSLRAFCGTREGKAFSTAALGLLVITAVSIALASHPALAWNGSNWRRFGGLTQAACLVTALIVAAWTRGEEDRIVPVFKAICWAGIPAAIYGIAQYFGWDPLLDPSAYRAGEGPFTIVRPPGPMGHSDYFAAFLLWPVFLGLALARLELSSVWVGRASALLGAIAILLTGSRGAMVGLAAGAVIYAFVAKPNLRVWGAAGALGAVAMGTFYFSPAGQMLRARAHWIGEDPAGGARLLLWRDSLRMAATHPFVGVGPDNFVAEFPRFQSVELAQAYPDFYHESPHNIWLDTLSGQGAAGLAAQLAMILLALWAGVRALKAKPEMASGLLAGLVAVVVVHQFAVTTAVNAFYLYLGCALLISLVIAQDRSVNVAPWKYRNFVLAGASLAAMALLVVAFRLVSTDFALASAERSLAAGDVPAAAADYHRAVDLRNTGLTADVYFSRRFARAAAESHDVLPKLYLGQLAAGSASLATEVPEGRPNAWFNLAELEATRSDTGAVETALRSAITESPNWFKPHWVLARLLFLQGRNEAAWQESQRAMQLNQKDPEVSSTLGPILSFRRDPAHSPSP